MKRIKKVLNHNVVLAEDSKGTEVVFLGAGIGFSKKKGDIIDEHTIEKTFVLESEGDYEHFEELIKKIPEIFFEASQKAIAFVEKEIDQKLDSFIYINLTDHIYFAAKRLEDKQLLFNNLSWEIESFYKKEYELAEKALEIINNELNSNLPKEEIAFIALHIVNSYEESSGMNRTLKQTKLMKEILNIIQYTFMIEFNEKKLSYRRLITHLRYFSLRVLEEVIDHNMEQMRIYHQIVKEFEIAYSCVEKIEVFIYENYNYVLDYNDKLYLTIHLNRLLDSIKDGEEEA